MNKKCPNCRLVNFSAAESCARCQSELIETFGPDEDSRTPGLGLLRRSLFCVGVCVVAIIGFYLSLIVSARSLPLQEKSKVTSAIALLRQHGFKNEAFFLENLTIYRSTDNWLNASVAKENAYAATNFPFEIITLYPDFFMYPADDTERAAILLHEAQHLKGKDEKGAYEFVWKNKKTLGWTKEKYGGSPVWQNVRKQTRDNAPNLFVCAANEFGDCTE